MKKRLNYLVGGYAGNGGNAGLLYLNCNNGLGNSNWNIAAREYDSFLFMVIQRCCIQAAASGTGVRSLVRKISNVCKSAVKVGGMGSYNGYVLHSESGRVVRRYGVDFLRRVCSDCISLAAVH